MSKVHTFKVRDRNRYRKVYRYIRKKPSNEYCSNEGFEMIAGYLTFTNSSGPETYTYPGPATFTSVPVATVTSVDSESNNQANVVAYITSISTTSITVSTSAPFTGRVHFIIVSQD